MGMEDDIVGASLDAQVCEDLISPRWILPLASQWIKLEFMQHLYFSLEDLQYRLGGNDTDSVNFES